MFFAVVECPGKSLKIIFLKGKWLNVVTAANSFHRMCERIPDAVFHQKKSKCDWLCYQCSPKRTKTICT